MKVLLDRGTTEFILEDKGKEGYRFAIHNRYINYDLTTCFFCIDDISMISEGLSKLINSELREVSAVGTTDPNLNIILCPKGAQVIREAGENFGRAQKFIDGKIVEFDEHYESNFIILEFDLCVDGCYGVQHWTASLTEEETEDFITQWLSEMHE